METGEEGMSSADPVAFQLDRLAQLLENNGYAVEVDYTGAAIIVWAEVWPIQLRLVSYNSPLQQSAPDDEDEK